MISYKEKIAEILAPHVDGLEKDEILDMLETPLTARWEIMRSHASSWQRSSARHHR